MIKLPYGILKCTSLTVTREALSSKGQKHNLTIAIFFTLSHTFFSHKSPGPNQPRKFSITLYTSYLAKLSVYVPNGHGVHCRCLELRCIPGVHATKERGRWGGSVGDFFFQVWNFRIRFWKCNAVAETVLAVFFSNIPGSKSGQIQKIIV